MQIISSYNSGKNLNVMNNKIISAINDPALAITLLAFLIRLRKYIGITVTDSAISFRFKPTLFNAPIIPTNNTIDWMAVHAKIMVMGVSL